MQSGFYNKYISVFLNKPSAVHYYRYTYSEYPQKLFIFKLAFNTGFEPVEPVSTPHGKSAPGLEYFTQAREF